MASKWLDFWTFADWSDDTKRPLFTIIEDLKEAADERQALNEVSHSTGFNADDSWPIDSGDAFIAGSGTPKNAAKIEKAVFPRPCVETSTINTGGGTVAVGDIPDSLLLSDLLTGPLGYASGTLKHMTDTSSGFGSGLARMAWVKQWFECLNYPEYYEVVPIEAGTGGAESEWVTDVETQYTQVATRYVYDVVAGTFQIGECFVTSPRGSSTPVDVYVTNDLNESAPWSTVTEVRDYTIGEYDTEIATNDWYTAATNAETFLVESLINFDLDNQNGDDEVDMQITVRNIRIRFKIPDIFRAASPNKFTATIKMYGFYDEQGYSNFSFDNLGTDETEDEVVFVTMTADGSDYYYLEIASPDFTNPTVPTLPTSGNSEINGFGMRRMSLSIDLASLTTIAHAVYLQVNKDDGSAFEYYTP
tara:strand:+ start:15295 stop:16548 length:1254 start_codon:yes stop_codon:yes gene_type:complete